MPLDKPSPARMYDYFLGGHHNFEVDRLAAEQVIATFPDVILAARANRAFLRRAVSFLVAQGIDQFLDIGSGIPTAGNVHEVAQDVVPAARVVYVDSDGVAVRHSQAILQDNPNATVIQADARQPEIILRHPEVRRLIDFTRPLGVLLAAVLPFIVDDVEAVRVVHVLRETMAPGSYLVISHGTDEGLPRATVAQGEQVYRRSTNPAKGRSRAAIAAFFKGLELVEPGIVYAPLWRPEGSRDLLLDEPERSAVYAGVGYKG
jgi:hypothetical protein